jgi:hypothetical protein
MPLAYHELIEEGYMEDKAVEIVETRGMPLLFAVAEMRLAELAACARDGDNEETGPECQELHGEEDA